MCSSVSTATTQYHIYQSYYQISNNSDKKKKFWFKDKLLTLGLSLAIILKEFFRIWFSSNFILSLMFCHISFPQRMLLQRKRKKKKFSYIKCVVFRTIKITDTLLLVNEFWYWHCHNTPNVDNIYNLRTTRVNNNREKKKKNKNNF